ncbi:hypothetical protein LIPSTDRAFT_223411 [Lipomyces starkeyi NRRL Y-11557]|uniref:Uncharacterized protein n=1 Tax=Lipomyces starkeyi NRRL Y-11557 TaxID=675824 RepID=A0A1E3QE45_LIPST|nr:hypothetical protein LIPSTDRAFT_223411 [Lipomyces starkeyi NRRL Y-11557]
MGNPNRKPFDDNFLDIESFTVDVNHLRFPYDFFLTFSLASTFLISVLSNIDIKIPTLFGPVADHCDILQNI